MMKKLCIIPLLLTTLLSSLQAQHNTYYIGHSGFGWDLIVGEMVNDLATDAGITTYDYGYQFIGGTCISFQWNNHDSAQGGTDSWVELATGNYDYLVLAEQIPIAEVINGSPWGCPQSSATAVDSFYDLATGANPNTRVYLMEFHNEVDQTGPDPYGDWSALNTAMRPLWEHVADSVSQINPGGNEVCLVPVAAAFEAMTDSILAGVFPGITNWLDVFDPTDTVVATIHPTEETYYLVACVHFATIFGQSPVGLTNQTFAAQGWAFDPPTLAQAAMMQEIAWEIVSNDPRSCVSTVSINEQSATPEVSIAYQESVIAFGNTSSFTQVELYDLSGQMVYTDDVNAPDYELNTSSLNKGIYIYRFAGSEHSVNGKVMMR